MTANISRAAYDRLREMGGLSNIALDCYEEDTKAMREAVHTLKTPQGIDSVFHAVALLEKRLKGREGVGE